MFIFKKEKHVINLVLQHIDKTDECLNVTFNAIKESLSGNEESIDAAVDRVRCRENEADELLRNIREALYSGAYLPSIRGDVYRLMSMVDDVCNKSEDCFDLICYQKPQIPEEYRSQLIAIVDLTAGCFSEFRNAFRDFFKEKGKADKLREHAQKVSELESLVDDVERALTAQIFESSLHLSEKMHLRRLLHRMVCISDIIEDAADELQLVSLKSII